MTLKELKIGESAVIDAVGGAGAMRQHFLDMGLIPGEKVTLVKFAPMGDPMELQIHGYELTLRLDDAAQIEITPAATAPAAAPARRENKMVEHPGLGEGGRYHTKQGEHPLPDGKTLTFALAGNQNCGKTTLFNQLTGSNQHVGNFPGVTVDRKSGAIKEHPETEVTDLPGIYSMSPYSSEEIVTRQFIIGEKPTGIINIVDATNIERNLYLTMQLMELDTPMVLALNMMDEVRGNGGTIRINQMEAMLGIPVVPISAAKNEGVDELVDHAIHVAKYQERGLDRAAAIADMRFHFIHQLVDQTVVKPHQSKEQVRSSRIDQFLTGKYTAIPAFVGIMALVFYLTFGVIGAGLQNLLEIGIENLTVFVDDALTYWNVNEAVHSLVIDGIFTGVGSVLSFLPIIVTLFFFLSLLEDTGYMARVAFVMDKLLRRIGLSGRSIVPMLIGFGCTVPGVMASRTLPSERDRKMTILLTPFMSCSAKLPIYSLFAVTFFPDHAALVMVGLYFLGIAVGILAAFALKGTLFRGEAVPFVMELPNYRLPGLKNVMQLLWEKARDFLERAFTVIFMATIVIWFLQNFDLQLSLTADPQESILAFVASGIAPLFAPLGFADWRVSTALITGFMAKESVVSTLTILFGSSAALGAALSPAAAAPLLVFCLLYTPCIAAVASVKRELGGRWAAVMVLNQCVVAWVAAFIVRMLALALV